MPQFTLTPAVPNGTAYVGNFIGVMPAFPLQAFATIYSDANMTTPITLPLALGGSGAFTFYAPAGQYVVQIGVSGNLVQQFVVNMQTSPTKPTTIASGQAALGTGAIASGAAASVVTMSAPGVVATDDVIADFSSDPTGLAGYMPGAMLTIVKYCTPNNVNFKVVNNTGSSITPAAVTLNWRVVR